MASISIIMPLYNKVKFVARAIDSALAQTWQDFEIVVIDDGSTDGSPEIVRAYTDPRVRLIQQPNAGPGAARNRGVKESSSKYVAFLDADDEYFPDFLQTSLRNLENNPDCVLSVVNHYRGPEKTEATTIPPFNVGISTGPWRLAPDSEASEMWGSLIFLQSWVVVCRRDVFNDFGGFYEQHCTFGEDQNLWLKIILNRKIYRDTTPLFWYHTEDSDLGFLRTRVSAIPVMPFLTDPKPIRDRCPSEYRVALERMFLFAASLNYSFMYADESVVSFWKGYLRAIPESHGLPLDRPRQMESSGKSSAVRFKLQSQVSSQIRAVCDAHSLTPNVFFLAVLAFLAGKYSAQETVVIGTPYETQEQEEIQGLFGCFTRYIPIRIDVDETSKTANWLAYVQGQFHSVWAHTRIGLDELIDLAAAPRNATMNPIWQLFFAFQEYESRRSDTSMSDIALYVWDKGNFEGALEYKAELFDAASIEVFAANFQRAVEALAGGIADRLDQIDLMDPKGRGIIDSTNRTEMPSYLGRTFLELFKEKLESCRDMPAVKSGESVLTYGELDTLSDGIANRLVVSGLRAGEPVGVYLQRDRWLLPSLIGVFKAGGAFVPLDPQYPHDRLAGIIEDAGLSVIVTTTTLHAEAVALASGVRTLCVDTGALEAGAVLPAVTADMNAYVLFTSGSTGKPKGVPIRHGSLANNLQTLRFEPGISRDDTILAFTTIAFDMSAVEILLPLISGARTVLLDDETAKDVDAIVQIIEREKVTFMVATPSRWSLLLETGWKCHPGMKIIAGGEAFPRQLADDLLATGVSVWNGYGPTETTVCVSQYRVIPESSPPCIGKPMANTGFLVLDPANRPLPLGIPGELGIYGEGVSAGYFNRPDLTAERFVEIEDDGTKRRVYKTGDLVQQGPTGDFRYLGRNDFQVKIRGFRVELGEIEAVMLSVPGIREAICTVWNRSEQDKRIVAYYRAYAAIDESRLKAEIRKNLPDYMVPGHFMAMDDFPRTPSGKTDRKSLPLPAITSEAAKQETAGTTLQEQLLAVWGEVLGCTVTGIDENFFDLGGHSLLAVELIRKLNTRVMEGVHGKNLRVVTLFQYPTVRKMEAYLREGESENSESINARAQRQRSATTQGRVVRPIRGTPD